MRTTDVDMMLETFDQAENKRKAIEALSKMLKISPEVVKEKLQQHGRVIDYGEKCKKTMVTEKADLKVVLPMPEYIQDILFREVAELEKRLDELQSELKITEDHYQVLRTYLHL